MANEAKLKDIRIPSLEFADTPLSDALQFIQSKSVELNFNEAEPDKKGINVILQAGDKSQTPITLRLKNVSLGDGYQGCNHRSRRRPNQ